MQARMKHPIMLVEGALDAALSLGGLVKKGPVPARTLELVNLRASQINGCSYCVEMHSRELKKGGDTDERLFAVAAWREAPYFTDAERAGLALAEAATRLPNCGEAVPDEVWREATRHYDETALAFLVTNIALINFWNRLNVTTRQMSGQAHR